MEIESMVTNRPAISNDIITEVMAASRTRNVVAMEPHWYLHWNSPTPNRHPPCETLSINTKYRKDLIASLQRK